jgi:hypothetical protein
MTDESCKVLLKKVAALLNKIDDMMAYHEAIELLANTEEYLGLENLVHDILMRRESNGDS